MVSGHRWWVASWLTCMAFRSNEQQVAKGMVANKHLWAVSWKPQSKSVFINHLQHDVGIRKLIHVHDLSPPQSQEMYHRPHIHLLREGGAVSSPATRLLKDDERVWVGMGVGDGSASSVLVTKAAAAFHRTAAGHQDDSRAPVLPLGLP